MTHAAILSREAALRVLGDRGHLLDAIPLVVDRDGSELGFFRADVEAMRDGRWQAKRHTAGRVERVIARR